MTVVFVDIQLSDQGVPAIASSKAMSGLAQATVGALIAIACTLLPYPILSIQRARNAASALSIDLGQLWQESLDGICIYNTYYHYYYYYYYFYNTYMIYVYIYIYICHVYIMCICACMYI